MIKMPQFSIQNKLFIQKLFSSLGVVSCHFVIIIAAVSAGLSVLWIGLGLLGLILLSAGILIGSCARSFPSRSLNENNNIEAEINKCVFAYSQKLRITPPRIIIQLNADKEVELEAHSLGFPFTNQLVITEDWLVVLNNGMSKESFAALIAHELSHIKHHDTLLTLIVNSLRLGLQFTLYLSLVAGVIMLGLTPFAVLGGVGLTLLSFVSKLAVITLCAELGYALFNRASEMQADVASLTLTENPQSTKRFIYDLYLQFLFFGKLVTENQWAARLESTSLPLPLIADLKAKHAQLSEQNTVQTFDELRAITRHNAYPQYTFSLMQLKNRALTWLNTHPYVDERVACIESAYTRPSR